MFQRIQSVFLILAVIAAILTFFFPLAEFISDMAYYKLWIKGLVAYTPDSDMPFHFYHALPLILLSLALIVLTTIVLLGYKNRIKQLKLLRIGVLLNILLIGIIFYYSGALLPKQLGMAPNYSSCYGIYFPLASLVFLIMANRGIRKDEALVRSTDRLR